MERAEVIRRVNTILVDEFEVRAGLLVPEVNLYEELDFDSLDAVDLIAAMEREFAIKINRQDAETEIREIRVLEDVVCFVASKLPS